LRKSAACEQSAKLKFAKIVCFCDYIFVFVFLNPKTGFQRHCATIKTAVLDRWENAFLGQKNPKSKVPPIAIEQASGGPIFFSSG